MKTTLKAVLMACVVIASTLMQPVAADEEADRETMRSMLGMVEKAINNRDLTEVLGFFLPESVVVFQNKTVLTGPEELQGFYTRMLGASDSILTDVRSKTSISAPASFYGADTAVAHGTVVDKYTFRGGASMELESAWTTTLVRSDDQWRVASLHLSANIFDNPLIDRSKGFLRYAAVGGFILGIVLTWLFMRRRKKTG